MAFNWNKAPSSSDAAELYERIANTAKATGYKPTADYIYAKIQQACDDNSLLPTEAWLSKLATNDSRMQEVKDRIRIIAQRPEPVLITGPTGTGKELVARALHGSREETGAPFVAENCGGSPEQLAASIFFGYKKGAFTGAIADQDGKLVAAGFGTIFLDEIGSMPLHMQSLLLRAIQQNEVYPVGGTTPVPINCRFVAASSRNIDEMVSNGTFLPDLFYRLNVFRIRIPSFENRPDDINVVAKALGYDAPVDKDFYPEVYRGGVRAIQAYIARMQAYGNWHE